MSNRAQEFFANLNPASAKRAVDVLGAVTAFTFLIMLLAGASVVAEVVTLVFLVVFIAADRYFNSKINPALVEAHNGYVLLEDTTRSDSYYINLAHANGDATVERLNNDVVIVHEYKAGSQRKHTITENDEGQFTVNTTFSSTDIR